MARARSTDVERSRGRTDAGRGWPGRAGRPGLGGPGRAGRARRPAQRGAGGTGGPLAAVPRRHVPQPGRHPHHGRRAAGADLLRELLFGKQKRRPRAPVPLVRPRRRPGRPPRRRAAHHLVRPRLRAGRDRGRAGCCSTRCGATAARPSRLVGPQAAAPAAGARCDELPAARRDRDLPRPLRPPRHGHRAGAGPPAVGAVPGAARRRRPPGALGRARRPDHRAGLGRGGTGRRACGSPPPPPGTSPAAGCAATARCGAPGWSPGARRRVFYTGDSGYFDGYAEIGAEHGPFDADADADRRVRPGLAGHPHDARRRRVAAHLDLRRRAARSRCTGRRSTWPCTTGPSRSTGSGARRRRATCGWPCPARASGSTSTTRPPVDGWWQAIA